MLFLLWYKSRAAAEIASAVALGHEEVVKFRL